MAADNNFKKPANRIVFSGQPLMREELIVETAGPYPGRLLKYGSSVKECLINDGVSLLAGWAGYDNVSTEYKKDSVDTIYAQYDHIECISGPGLGVVGALAACFSVANGDKLIPWSAGCVAPAIRLPGGAYGLKVPFEKKASQYDTTIDLIPGHILAGCPLVYVTTADASGTLDVGLGVGSESGFDADGILDGVSLAATGWVAPKTNDTSADSSNTLGLLLSTAMKDATASTPYFFRQPKLATVIGSTLKSIDYTTSDYTVAGYFYVPICGEGVEFVGKAKQALSASTSIQDILLESLI